MRIEHRKPWTHNPKYRDHVPSDVRDTYYDLGMHKDYVLYDDNNDVVAISKNRDRLKKIMKENDS